MNVQLTAQVLENKDIGFGMVDSQKDAKVAKKLGKSCVTIILQCHTYNKSSVKTKLMFNIGNVYILYDVAKAQFHETFFDMQEVFRNIGQNFLNMGP